MTFISVDNLLIIHEELCRFNSWSFEFRIPPETSEATLWIDSPGPLGPETKLVILRYHELSHRTVETKNGYRSTYENMFAGYFGVQQGTRVLIYSHMYFCPIGSSMGASNAWESSSQTSLEAGRISKKNWGPWSRRSDRCALIDGTSTFCEHPIPMCWFIHLCKLSAQGCSFNPTSLE